MFSDDNFRPGTDKTTNLGYNKINPPPHFQENINTCFLKKIFKFQYSLCQRSTDIKPAFIPAIVWREEGTRGICYVNT